MCNSSYSSSMSVSPANSEVGSSLKQNGTKKQKENSNVNKKAINFQNSSNTSLASNSSSNGHQKSKPFWNKDNSNLDRADLDLNWRSHLDNNEVKSKKEQQQQQTRADKDRNWRRHPQEDDNVESKNSGGWKSTNRKSKKSGIKICDHC